MTADNHPEHHVDCQQVVAQLYVYLDQMRQLGQPMTPAVQQQIQHHLGACAPCLEAMDFEAEFLDMVRQRCTERPPVGLQDRILSTLRQAPPDGPSLGGIPKL